VFDREAVQTVGPVGLEQVDDLLAGERMPVLIVEQLDEGPPEERPVPAHDT
jgi:hypothetical protein